VCVAEVCPTEVCLAEVRPEKTNTTEVHPAKVQLADSEVRVTEGISLP